MKCEKFTDLLRPQIIDQFGLKMYKKKHYSMITNFVLCKFQKYFVLTVPCLTRLKALSLTS